MNKIMKYGTGLALGAFLLSGCATNNYALKNKNPNFKKPSNEQYFSDMIKSPEKFNKKDYRIVDNRWLKVGFTSWGIEVLPIIAIPTYEHKKTKKIRNGVDVGVGVGIYSLEYKKTK